MVSTTSTTAPARVPHQVKLTDRFILGKMSKSGRPSEREAWTDEDERGLVLRVTEKGYASFAARYRIKGEAQRFEVLGDYPTLSLSAARKRMAAIRAAALHGVDLVKQEEAEREAARQREAERRAREENSRTVRQLVSEYEAHLDRRGKRTRNVIIAVLRNHVVDFLGERTLATLTRSDAVELLDHIEKKGHTRQVDAARSHFAAALEWAADRGYLPADANVMKSVRPRFKQVERQRLPTPDETGRIWRAAEQLGGPGEDFTKLLMLEGLRRDEVRRLRRSEVDLDEKLIRLPPERTKQNRATTQPLSEPALKIVKAAIERISALGIVGEGEDFFVISHDGRNAWSAQSRFKRALDRASGTAAWTWHDCRRLVRSGLSALRVPYHICEAALSHAPERLARIYDQAPHVEEVREALEAWAKRLAFVVAKPAANVHEFPKSRRAPHAKSGTKSTA